MFLLNLLLCVLGLAGEADLKINGFEFLQKQCKTKFLIFLFSFPSKT